MILTFNSLPFFAEKDEFSPFYLFLDTLCTKCFFLLRNEDIVAE